MPCYNNSRLKRHNDNYMKQQLQNPAPKIYTEYSLNRREEMMRKMKENDEDVVDEIDCQEVFDQIRHLNDPEYPLSLEQLNIVNIERINVDHERRLITIRFTPTIPHCSMATMIGLMIKIKLSTSISNRYKVQVEITEGTHVNQLQLNKQLNDKERVAAAVENPNIFRVIKKGIANTDKLQ